VIPTARETARFYDALARGSVRRGIWGLESRFDPAKIIDSRSVDRHFRPIVMRFVGPGTRVLDVGCGPGGFTAVLAETAGETVGLDVSESWVDAANRTFEARGSKARAVLGSGAALPFEVASFDVVTLIDVLHHLDEPKSVLAETRRVLRPGGRLLVFEPNKLNPLLTALCLFDRNEWGFLRPGMGREGGYRRMLSPWFAVDEVKYSGLLIGPDGPAARAIADRLAATGNPLGWLSPKLFFACTAPRRKAS
jgi:SAM-dependent methyltransferase